MQFSQDENPQSYIDNSITYSGILRKTDRLSNKQTLFQECRGILQRPHESRLPSDNQTLLQLADKSELLKELSDLYGLEFVKGLLRNAKLEFVEEGQVIADQQQEINYTIFLLEGKLGVEGIGEEDEGRAEKALSPLEQEALQNLSLKTEALFDKLTLLAKKERELQRRTLKLKRKNTLPISDYKFMLPVLSKHDYSLSLDNIQRSVLMGEEFGGKQRLNGRNFKSRAIALERSTLLIIQVNFLFYWLEAAFKSKLIKNIERMKTIPAFEALQNQKLAEIIISMKMVRRGKNRIVYSQGEPAEMLYLLVEGQLKVSKQADLFRENPNTLFTDRRRLQQRGKAVSRSLREEEEQDLLPFANLTALYNYRPTRKTIDMGLLSSFGLFGEEELVFRTRRETTVQVQSIQACYYQIEFKKVLEIIGSKQSERFREALEASLSKKVLYRQSELAEKVHLQNQHNLNYFYLAPGATERSPRRPKLDRINKEVESHSARQPTPDPIAPFYTTFNFNKMISQRYSTIDKHNTLKSTSENDSAEDLPTEMTFSGLQEKVVDMSHTWDPIQRKVRQEGRLSKRLSPFRHTINIQDPLIDTQFFDHVAKEQRRINKEVRNIRFSLGKRTK